MTFDNSSCSAAIPSIVPVAVALGGAGTCKTLHASG